MGTKLELSTASVIDKKNTEVIAYVTITKAIHIVEKCQITESSEIKHLAVCKGCTNERANTTINTETTYVGCGCDAGRQFKHIPTTE